MWHRIAEEGGMGTTFCCLCKQIKEVETLDLYRGKTE